MALWDSISKKASETTAKAIQQAKILSETAKLNSMISDEESKISSNYFQIGKLYCAIHQQDPEDCFVAMLTAIAEAEQKIQEYRQQIQQIKGVLRCEKCGAEVAKGNAFCSSCGAAMPKTEPAVSENHVICASCGAQVEKGMRFCTSCGRPMLQTVEETPAVVDAEAVAETSTEATAETEKTKRVCASCGAEMGDGIAFCTECGTKIEVLGE